MSEKTAEVQTVTQPLDHNTREGILKLWENEQAVIDDPEARLAQVTFVAYAAGELVGITSAKLIHEQNTRQPLYALRALVGKDWRQQSLAYDLLAHSIEQRGNAFADGSDLSAVGLLFELEASFVLNRPTLESSKTYHFSVNKTPKTFHFIGFDDRGIGEFVHYFPGAKIMGMARKSPSIKPQTIAPAPELRHELVHGNLTEEQQDKLIKLWLSAGVLPNRDACLARLPQVAALAYNADSVVGVGSLFPVVVPHLRAELLGYRSFISAEVRGGQTATELLNVIFEERNRQFANNDVNTALPGIAYSLQNAQLNASVVELISPRSGFILAGFDKEGRQIRVRYFDGATITLTQ